VETVCPLSSSSTVRVSSTPPGNFDPEPAEVQRAVLAADEPGHRQFIDIVDLALVQDGADPQDGVCRLCPTPVLEQLRIEA